jgi:hypothetical protein
MRRCEKCYLYFDEKNDLNEENLCKECERKSEMGKKKNKSGVQKTVGKGNNTNNNDNEAWEVKIDCVTECSKAPSEITVWMMPLVKEQIEALMTEYKNIEWLAYLIGNWVDDKTPVVKELFIPEQKVSSAAVNDINCPEHNEINVIGVVHSHHNMHHKFSQIDDDWINQNHNISLVVSHTGMEGQVRWKTPCGSLKTVEAKTKLWYDVEFDKEDFIKKAKEKIKENTYSSGSGWNKWNNKYSPQQESYMNGNSVKTVVENDKNETIEEDTINNSDTEEDIPWEVEMDGSDFDEAETLKDALTAYEEEITDISKATIPKVKQTSVQHAK